MAWILLTQDDLLGKLTGAEVTAVTTKALAPGQVNPVPEEIANAIQEIRGRVAACPNNRLGDQAAGQLIPEELKPAALAIIRYRVLSRLPISALVTPAREREYNDALPLLSAVASCKFRIEQPANLSPQKIAGPAVGLVTSRPRRFTPGRMTGL